jgi:hypothetical protein
VLPFGSGGGGGVDFVEQGREIGGLGFIEPAGAILRWQAEAIAGTADQAPLAAAFGVVAPGIALALEQTHGDDLIDNARQFARGLAANNVLLWGARGMGKSSLVKAVHADINQRKLAALPLKLIEIHREDIDSLPALMALLRPDPHRFIVFCDDLSFDNNDTSYKSLKAALDGGGMRRGEVFFLDSAMHLECAHGGDEDHGSGLEPRLAALDIKKFFRAEIRAEASFGDGKFA